MKLFSLLLAGCLAAVTPLQATVTLDVLADKLRDSFGNSISTNALILLVADTNNNGFGPVLDGASLSINSALNGSDDRVIGLFTLSVWDTAGMFQTPAGVLFDLDSVTDWTQGDQFGIYWFPELTLSSTQLSAGDAYGAFTGATGSTGESWITPPNSGTGTYTFFTETGADLAPETYDAFPDISSYASLTVVPEPSVAVLFAGVLATLGLRHGRRRGL